MRRLTATVRLGCFSAAEKYPERDHRRVNLTAMEQNLPRRWTGAGRMALIIGLAVVFGIVAAWIKGNGSGLRDAIGNISAVWLLLPFAAGAATGSRRIIVGAISGLVATLA